MNIELSALEFPNADIDKFQYLDCYHQYFQSELFELFENISELYKQMMLRQYGPDGFDSLTPVQSTTTLKH